MGKFQLGSYQHKKLSCELITAHHQVYKIKDLEWPNLDPETKAKLADIPWRSLAQQYLNAAQVIKPFAASYKATMLRKALEAIATETQRQGAFLEEISKRYGPKQRRKSDLPVVEADYKRVSHGLNVTLFLGAGLYELVAQTQYLPAELLKLFDQHLNEQARHACFFVNWLAFEAQDQQKSEYELFGLFSLWYQRQQILSLTNRLNRNDYDDNLPVHPTPNDVFMGQWRFSDLTQACCQGYTRRFETFDDKLKRPVILPQMAKLSQNFLGFWPERVDQPRQAS